MTLLLLTGACGMIVGERGLPPLGLFVATMVGLALACGGASALNHVLDADIDKKMGKRTADRPVAAGRIEPGRALEFGLTLGAFSFVLLASAVNVLTAALALAGGLFYVVVYTRLLKRSTPQNIVIGGAAGAVPPLVGWAAATGNLTVPALFLFLIVFFWTPPHFWALALLIRENYEAANVPMLPNVKGERETVRQIVLYTLVLIAITLVPVAYGTFGVVYAVCALALGADVPRVHVAASTRPVAPARGVPVPLLPALPRAALRRDGDRRPLSDGIWITELEAPGDGIRLAVKDLFDTAGITTTYGSIIFADTSPPRAPRSCAGSRRRGTSTSASRTCTSSRTASRR